MTVPSQEALSHSILTSKHLIVVLGKKKINLYLVNTSYFMKGAGVSQGAGIQTFRGPIGLFGSMSKNILELFDKNTFEVMWAIKTIINMLTA